MPTGFPATYDTETATSLGTNKANDVPVIDTTLDNDALEFNTNKGAVRQLQLALGKTPDGTLTSDGDAGEANIKELLEFQVSRADRAGFHEDFLGSSVYLGAGVVSIHLDQLAGGAAPAFGTIAGATGVANTISGAGPQCGLLSTDAHFHFRYTYCRIRFYLDTIAFAPWANTDVVEMGLWFGVNDYVRFRSTAAGGVFPDFTYEIYDGGAGTGAVLTGSAPTAGEWHVAEILTTSAGAYFFMDRGGAGGYTEYTSGLYTGTAPDAGQCNPYYAITCAAGGPVISSSAVTCQDTRVQ